MSKLTRSVLVDIELRLKNAGVPSPRFDAESLVAFSLGIERNRIGLVKDIEDDQYREIEKLVEKIKKGADWAFSLRKIHDKEGNFVCEDNCESLGQWPIYFNKDAFHIDTSSFMVKADVARKLGHAWYSQWGADRRFFSGLKQYFPNFSCSKEYSLCYRLDGNPNSVTAEFFEKGNKENEKLYSDGFPWKKTFKEEYTVGPGITIVSG